MSIQVFWNLDKGRLVKSLDSDAPPATATLKYLVGKTVQLFLIDEDGELTDYEADSPTIVLGIKLKDEFDNDFLFDVTDWTWNADDECYEATITADSAAVSTALAENDDVSDDEALVEASGEFEITLASDPTHPICHDGFLPVEIQNKIIRGDEEGVPATSSRLWPIKHLIDVTGLTGGGLTKLDGALSITSADEGRLFVVVISDVFQIWQVVNSTAAEDTAAGIVHPENFHSTSNPYLYVQRL